MNKVAKRLASHESISRFDLKLWTSVQVSVLSLLKQSKCGHLHWNKELCCQIVVGGQHHDYCMADKLVVLPPAELKDLLIGRIALARARRINH